MTTIDQGFPEIRKIQQRIPGDGNPAGMTRKGVLRFIGFAAERISGYCAELADTDDNYHARPLIKSKRYEAEILVHALIDIWLDNMADQASAPDDNR